MTMKKINLQLFLVFTFAAVLIVAGVCSADLGLAVPAQTNSYLSVAKEGGTLMYSFAHALPPAPGYFAYRYLSGVGLGRGDAYTGEVVGKINLATMSAALNLIEQPESLGIKFITSGTNSEGWSLGADVKGQNWEHNPVTNIEERIYAAGNPSTVEVALFYGNQKIIDFGDVNVYVMVYYNTNSIKGYTSYFNYSKAAGLQGDASNVADAFIADFDRGGGKAIVIFDAIDPVIYETGDAVINGGGPYTYALYTWQGRIQTIADGPVCAGIPAGDINLDCVVNLEDIAIIAANWTVCNWDVSEFCQ